jgi:hypothetical protein
VTLRESRAASSIGRKDVLAGHALENFDDTVVGVASIRPLRLSGSDSTPKRAVFAEWLGSCLDALEEAFILDRRAKWCRQ